ncbi:hypothetical protein SOVF_041950 [Spinacia oleracea]|uniref:CRAL-TRIO domain-containing protein n=1 Tax=Spinacia oleracea TaxID=3562 RepID=A0A9R0I9P7_SPIOL|nr:uncharacterized protein LOC110784603 [Spinacia oleracea]XP_056686169.1 uncharacterized protein LOC110784603 [Spinacia oleracea]KNA21570.1 hypothetical protein SOVF_041950 [Spinacia oleracea]
MAETNHASNNGKDNTAEHHKLALMRAFVESRDPSSKEVDDLALRRFLRARDLNVEKASGMFLKYLKWRTTFLPKGCVTEAEIQHDLSQNKIHLGGQDKKGRPIVVAFAGRHYQNSKSGGLDEFKRLVVYTLDKLCARMPVGQEKFLAIGDLQGWGYSNSDIRGYLGSLSILQDCYPERLGKLYIVHAPKVFMAVWKIIYPFIDDNTKTKIEFVEKKQLKSTMLQDIDESQLPDIYGGKFSIVPIQDA